jgi:hypothetical protein
MGCACVRACFFFEATDNDAREKKRFEMWRLAVGGARAPPPTPANNKKD